MKTISIMALAASLLASTVSAQIQTKQVVYQQAGVTLEGYLAWDDQLQGKRPGILIIHDWNGLGRYEESRAKQIAELGYVAFALDIYGKGVRPKNKKEAGAESTKYKKDRTLMRARAQAGLEAFMKNPKVDRKAIAVIGYCFGGTTALEFARSGVPVLGTVSFHGHLDSPNTADAKKIKGKLLILHGADDPYVPASQIEEFKNEMTTANVDWQFTMYSQAVHSFTNPEAGNDNSKGSAYNKSADMRSWIAMQVFFDEIFKQAKK